MNRQKIIIGLALLGAISMPLFAFYIRSSNATAPSPSAQTTQIQQPAKLDICSTITPAKLKDILSIDFNKPSITKASVGTGLSSDTCSYIANPADSAKNLQIVVRYADTESYAKVMESWELSTKDAPNKTNYKEVGEEAFISKSPSGIATLYMLNKDNYLTITSATATDEQLIKIVHNIN